MKVILISFIIRVIIALYFGWVFNDYKFAVLVYFMLLIADRLLEILEKI